MLSLKGVFILFAYLGNAYSLGPISLTMGAGILAGLGYNLNFIKDSTYCKFTECCNEDYIPADINKLERELKSNLFGQHIVIQQLVPALRAHFSQEVKSKKALVLSFHGTQGTGKNYVAEFIAKSLYKNGVKSKFVHMYKGRVDFPVRTDSEKYQERIKKEVSEAVEECPRSLFIFDEVDKMPPGIFESLAPLVDYHTRLRGVDYSKAIFVLLSNTAGIEISLRLGELMLSGTLRERTKLSDFERTIELAAYNLESGMKKSGLIETSVVDHYIPFLPLERFHVWQCFEGEFKRWNEIPHPQVIDALIKENIVFDKKTGLFAISGCKTLGSKVGVEVSKSKQQPDRT